MGVYCKIFIRFEKNFWGQKSHFFIASENKGEYPYWIPVADDIVICVVTGEQAKRVEKMESDQVKDEILNLIKKAYGISNHILDIHVPKWSTNPRFLGTYSFFPTGALKNDYEEFYAPVKCIHFAGEAFCKNYKAYLHGAYNTGEDAAL